ncbi:MAG TPA: GIY-YIG nuclease family protein [Chloroflexia bacterium]|nr:GIY-YIG nuclease family protein [Chloroflexia bacterium]
MNRRKEIMKEYKERKLHGGVFKISNRVNGKYFIDRSANLESIYSRFQFSVNTGGIFEYKLKKDWQEFGAQAFELEVVEELIQRPDQSEAEFMGELKTLEELWRANSNLNPADEY